MTSADETLDDHPNAARGGPARFTARVWDRAEHQRLWLHLQSRAWRTLAVVPGEEWMSTYDVASLITAVGAHHGESMGVFDFRDIRLNRVLSAVEAATRDMRQGERIVFATRSIKENLATIPLARASDGVVLCVSLGSTSKRLAEETLEQVGRDRLLGTLLIRERATPVAVPPPGSLVRRLEALW